MDTAEGELTWLFQFNCLLTDRSVAVENVTADNAPVAVYNVMVLHHPKPTGGTGTVKVICPCLTGAHDFGKKEEEKKRLFGDELFFLYRRH